ncbi:UPF0149 family protein [Salinimonas marina]|uniref:UPF0149 family protein n=1 Tax=Salinimonas marina TaxID=2785918 RepID=A0A7S9DYA5_9ALTE|nr:UPF0149 family protein [Salinimonas marina]QPG06206.1 UPF0149 family protein [Salinimonas marina]
MAASDTLTIFYQTYPEAQVLPPQMHTRGLIFAIAAAPEIPMPETWMPWLVSAGSPSQTLTDEQVDNLAHHLMLGLRDTLQQMNDNRAALPAPAKWSEKPEERQPLQQWLQGLLTGHQQLETIWQQAWAKAQASPDKDGGLLNEAPEKRLSRCLKLFTTLANPEAATKGLEAAQAARLKQNLPQLAGQLPAILQDYIKLAGELAPFLPQQFENFQQTPDDAS